MDKFNRRLVKVTRQHGEEARELLKLMGIPVVEAPCEAEAQCAALVSNIPIKAVDQSKNYFVISLFLFSFVSSHLSEKFT